MERGRQEENKIQRERERERELVQASSQNKQSEEEQLDFCLSQHHLFRRKEAKRGDNPESREREKEGSLTRWK